MSVGREAKESEAALHCGSEAEECEAAFQRRLSAFAPPDLHSRSIHICPDLPGPAGLISNLYYNVYRMLLHSRYTQIYTGRSTQACLNLAPFCRVLCALLRSRESPSLLL